MNEFLSGVFFSSFFFSGLIFLRNWKMRHDGFLLFFGAACWILALEKLIMVVLRIHTEEQSLVYLVRLVAFILIISAIIVKNRNRR